MIMLIPIAALAALALYMSIQSSMARIAHDRDTSQTRRPYAPMTARPGAYRNRLGED